MHSVARSAVARLSFSIAADGRYAAAFVADGRSPLALEHWDLTGPAVERQLLKRAGGESTLAQSLCLPAARILITRPEPGVHRVALISCTPEGLVERPVGTVASQGFRLVPSPDPAVLAVAVGSDGDISRIWHVTPDGLRYVITLPGKLGRTFWLDMKGRHLGATHRIGDQTTTVSIDLGDATVEPFVGLPEGARVLLASPESGLLVLATPDGDALRLGHTQINSPGRVSFADPLQRLEGTVLSAVLDPSGTRLAVTVAQGARSRLYIYSPGRDDLTQVPLPAGVIPGHVTWSARGLVFPFSSPSSPTGLAQVTDEGGPWRCDRLGADLSSDARWAGARLVEVPGRAGPVEAIVYGSEDWREARQFVVALHGGPEAAWQFGFDPLFQEMAAAGLTVIAPNQRGSTGYGAAHREAIHSAWGGPDLDDICDLAQWLQRERRAGPAELLLYGISYGAFLALIAASAKPELWSRCVAIAPFLSGPLLYADAGVGVRAMLDRLGGRDVLDDTLGQRDLITLGSRIRAPLLIVHGTNDETIPVTHSRRLRESLLGHGRAEGRDFVYCEVDGAGHNPLTGVGAEVTTDRVIRFLTAGQLSARLAGVCQFGPVSLSVVTEGGVTRGGCGGVGG